MSNHTCSDRPLPTCKASNVVIAAIFAFFKTSLQRWRPLAAITKEVARPMAAPLLLVSFVLALNRVNVVAVTTILVLYVGVIGHHVPCH